jgi:UDP-N-acetylmuramate dehydrogenase
MGLIVKEFEPLSKHTNFRIGGPARWFVEVRSEDELREAIAFSRQQGVPFAVLGGGSNTLAADEGHPGVVIKIVMRGVKIDGTTVTADAGAMSAAVARQTADAGLQGMEWAISLPGTIGGAVRGNAGCFGGEMKDVVQSVRVLRDMEIIEIGADELRFGYRESTIKHSSDIILSVIMELQPGDRAVLLKKLDDTLAKRKASQPLYAGSAGCIFKNYEASEEDLQRLEAKADVLPPEMKTSRRISAGWLIDKLGLKGTKIGNAQISPEHGNFIVNLGGATASDVMQLIALVKTRARNEFGIQLQEEVQYL